MNKIKIESCRIGDVIFEYEKENNTVKDTVEYAVSKGINLSESFLFSANLKDAKLKGAKLAYSCITLSNLKGADFHKANLFCVEIRNCNLVNADFSGADLREANFRGENLSGVDFSGADLRGADLRDTNLKGANFKKAKLFEAIINGAENIPDTFNLKLACPKSGSFIGWKKVGNWLYGDSYLVKLKIPADAKRCSATSKKCRCDKAKVLEITDTRTGEKFNAVVNDRYSYCIYRVGEMVYPDYFDENRWNECSHGIHFFMDKQDALDY